MITYPRKCDDCDHIANNPANWHYHKRTHEKIPPGQQCDFGCGQLAHFRKTSGKYVCVEITQQCPGYIIDHSARIAKMWRDGDWEERKALQGERTKTRTDEQIQEQLAKQIETKKQKRIILEPSYERKTYNRTAIYHSNRTYELHKSIVNPLNLPRGKRDYHLDHCVSRFVGFLINIPIDIMSSPENLRMITYTHNASKNNKCSLHPLELLNSVDAPPDLIEEVTKKLHLVEHLLP